MNQAQKQAKETDLHTKLLLLRPVENGSNQEEKPFEKTHKDSMLGAMGPALQIGRIFGFLPIPCLDSYGNIKDFKWQSCQSIYTILVIVLVQLRAILSVARLAFIGVSIKSSVDAVFFSLNFTALCIFVRLAISWKSISRCWDYVEQTVMGSFGWPVNLGRKTFCMTVFMVIFGLGEFILSIVSSIVKVWPCRKKRGLSFVVERFFVKHYESIFFATNFAVWKAFIVVFVQLVATCVWNFVDLMIILISMVLSERFRLLNERIFSCDGLERPHEFWRRTRETYFTLSELTYETDRSLGALVVLSFAGNLYFICVQLMHSVSASNTTVLYDFYFVFSLVFLSVRTCLVGVMAARIYEESKRPKEILYNVPTENYCIEVDRFLKHVCSDQIAITGRNFFALTRSILLTVAGTVVTYEIILVQFNPTNDQSDDIGIMNVNVTSSTV